MADKHPYVPGPGGLVQVLNHFRKSFPNTVGADTLRKLGYAPKNESYVLNVLRHLGLIDEEGKRTAEAREAFSEHDDSAFAKKFAAIVQKEYSGLFDLYTGEAWTLDQDTLITFFRSADQTTAIVGKRQASTFQLLAAFSGHGEIPETRNRRTSKKAKMSTASTKAKKKPAKTTTAGANAGNQTNATGSKTDSTTNVGLTVRIEINLPSDGDQETYDRIFKSIRENFLNG